ncbi:MAG: hypothetical protein JWP63_5707 [Candidatus Solibacter sp.]|nr:hypothetical protein [Candidatus Solibacter sp.]
MDEPLLNQLAELRARGPRALIDFLNIDLELAQAFLAAARAALATLVTTRRRYPGLAPQSRQYGGSIPTSKMRRYGGRLTPLPTNSTRCPPKLSGQILPLPSEASPTREAGEAPES